MQIAIEPPKAADEWALNICNKISDVTEYWNPIGGTEFFDRSKYSGAGIKLTFQNFKATPYQQINHNNVFEANLSIIDTMMFNSPDAINTMLDNYECL